MSLFNRLYVRQWISLLVAMGLSAFIGCYFFPHDIAWVVLSAFVACVISRGAPLTQALAFFLWMLIVLICAGTLVAASMWYKASIVTAIVLMTGVMAYRQRPLTLQQQISYGLVAVIVLLGFLVLPPSPTFSDSFIALVVGTLIGLLFGQLPFYLRLEKQFRLGILPVVNALTQYSNALTDLYWGPHAKSVSDADRYFQLLPQRKTVEAAFLTRANGYPEWVYDVGFAPGLRAGMRFFLLNLERATELLFTLDYYLAQPLPPAWRDVLTTPLRQVAEQNSLLFQALADWLATGVTAPATADFTSDIQALEAAMEQLIPSSLELMDLSPDNLILAIIVRDYKALRTLLLQEIAALPTG